MICHCNTLVQFVAAIYLTLAFDTVLFKTLWSLKYVPMLLGDIEKQKPEMTTKVQNKLVFEITNNAKEVEKKSRVRGKFMLVLCVIILILGCIESDFCNLPIQINNRIYSFLFFLTIGTILSMLPINSNNIVIIIRFFVFIICLPILLCAKYNYAISFDDLHSKHFSTWLLIVLLAPIIYQFILNWLYSNTYLVIARERIAKCFEEYDGAKKANCQENVPIRYKDVFTQAYFDSRNGNQDTVLTKISNRFEELLLKDLKMPSMAYLLYNALTHINKSCYDMDSSQLEQSANNDDAEIVPYNNETQAAPNYIDLCKEYDNLKRSKKIKMSQFCKDKHIDFDKFKEFYDVWK